MRLWDSVKAAAAGVEDDGGFDKPAGPEDCEARRAAAFEVAAEELGLPDDWGDGPYGVVIELGQPGKVATIIAFATGESAFLSSTGTGFIGRPNHVHVVLQAKRLVKAAAAHASLLQPTTEFPRPPAGAIRFYLLTPDGVLTAEESTGAVRNGQSPLSPLLEAGDELISELMQYGWGEVPVPPLKAVDWVKALAMVAAIGALTYAAWLIPIAWLRWPAVALGAFFTIAAAIVPYAMLTAPRVGAEGSEGAAA